MKKLSLTIAIILGLGMTAFAQNDNHNGGVFQRGDEPRESGLYREDNKPMLPGHNQSGDQDAPLGSGIAVLLGLGGAYLVAKKRGEE